MPDELDPSGTSIETAEADPLAAPEPLTARLEREGRGRTPRRIALIAVTGSVGALFLVLSLRSLSLSVVNGADPEGNSSLGSLFAVLVSLSFIGAAYLMVRRQNKPNTLSMMSAVAARPGDLRETRSALHDMCLASGLSPTPAMYVIETPAVNALIVGREEASPVVVVTRGMAGLLSVDEQRAVMAHLLARMRIGLSPTAEGMSSVEEQADALAMATLRDPRALLSALERSRTVDSRLRIYGYGVFDGYAFLPFMPWERDPSLHERRIRRLRAVLGAEGAASS